MRQRHVLHASSLAHRQRIHHASPHASTTRPRFVTESVHDASSTHPQRAVTPTTTQGYHTLSPRFLLQTTTRKQKKNKKKLKFIKSRSEPSCLWYKGLPVDCSKCLLWLPLGRSRQGIAPISINVHQGHPLLGSVPEQTRTKSARLPQKGYCDHEETSFLMSWTRLCPAILLKDVCWILARYRE